MNNKIAIAVHGGAGHNVVHLRKNEEKFAKGLREALQSGYSILKKGGTSLNAVEAAVKILEDDPLFNAGRGAALNSKGEVEMDASIMEGKRLRAGAVSMVRGVKNPVSLARHVMDKTKHVFLSGYGALEIAKDNNIALKPNSYFITDYQNQQFLKLNSHETLEQIMKKRMMGTVGAVARDKNGNLAAATSTGGLSNCLPGRIGDSCVIGAGCYANNICAVSGTGDGEVLITGVVAHTIAMVMELKGLSMQEACDYVIHTRNKLTKGVIGVISVDAEGRIGASFNSKNMKRGCIDVNGTMQINVCD